MPHDPRNAQSRTVTVDDTGVRRTLADGTEESVTWDTLSAVVIRVMPNAPWQEDVFLMLAGSDGNGTAVPSGDPAADALIERLTALRGIGRLMHRTATLAFVEASIVDDREQLCAHATGTFKYVKRRLPTGPASANAQRLPSTD